MVGDVREEHPTPDLHASTARHVLARMVTRRRNETAKASNAVWRGVLEAGRPFAFAHERCGVCEG